VNREETRGGEPPVDLPPPDAEGDELRAADHATLSPCHLGDNVTDVGPTEGSVTLTTSSVVNVAGPRRR
jgi:hypothetical protein